MAHKLPPGVALSHNGRRLALARIGATARQQTAHWLANLFADLHQPMTRVSGRHLTADSLMLVRYWRSEASPLPQ